MDDVGVYEGQEVEEFVQRYFNDEVAQTLSPIIDTAVNRFNIELQLEGEDKVDSKVKLSILLRFMGR